jgi:hypothetical protein
VARLGRCADGTLRSEQIAEITAVPHALAAMEAVIVDLGAKALPVFTEAMFNRFTRLEIFRGRHRTGAPAIIVEPFGSPEIYL